MPVAVVIGHHPMYYMAACYTGSFDLDELALTGTLLGEPVELVKCETIDVEAPAHAEIIVEGEIPPGVREEEGPFSEFQGYYFGGSGKNPIIQIKAITMRKDAIYKANQNGPDVEGCHYHRVPMSAALFRDLRNVNGHVDLKDVYAHWGTIFGVVVQMTPDSTARQRTCFWQRSPAPISTRSSPLPWMRMWTSTTPPMWPGPLRRGLIRCEISSSSRACEGTALDESVTEKLRPPRVTIRQDLTSKVLIDATKPPTTDPERRDVYERLKPIGLDTIRK